MPTLPAGTVTFLFTDIEGSTRLWEAHDAAMRTALTRHDTLLRAAIGRADGHVFKTVGDGFCAAFATAQDAVAAALAAQQALHIEPWPTRPGVRVRMALHTGAAELRDADYFGAPLNRVARLLAAGHGGQTLISEATYDLARDQLPAQASLKPLGDHGLKDLARRERVFQLCHPDLPAAFPPLKSLSRPVDAQAPSIAVLPFVNLSADNENEYFADGLAEELMNVLAKIRGLRVASRLSSFYFKGKDIDLPGVAQKLNVETVLEGSIRKAGNRVRITAQLIEVATDSHLWSDTYDRELTDIFAVEDDIARSVVVELRRALLDEAPTVGATAHVAAEVATLGRARGDDPEAYRLYLQGKFLVARNVPSDTKRGLDLLREALSRQPDFALAWVAVARGHRSQAEYGGAPVVEAYAEAYAALDRALALAPEFTSAHVELGVLRTADWDWRGADAALARALQLAPDNAEALSAAGNIARIRNRIPGAVALGERSVAIDPLSAEGRINLAISYAAAGRLDAAEAVLHATLDLAPATGGVRGRLARIRIMQGRYAEAKAFLREEPLEYMRLYATALAEHAGGHAASADAALHALTDEYADTCAFQIAVVHAFRGEVDAAFTWLEHAHARRDHGLHGLHDRYILGNLHGDPRWLPFLVKMGLAD